MNSISVEYIAHMGSDLTVVNSARVSMDKHKELFEEQDKKLLKYLAKHSHWSPFAHPQIQLRITAPVCIRTQCFKHVVGFVANEISRRYVDSEPTFFTPVLRKRSESVKQGSLDEFPDDLERCEDVFSHVQNLAAFGYKKLLEAGVCPEQARMILPQNLQTSWYWTGSLAAYARFYKQRTDPHAQKEIQDLARMVGDIIQPLFPNSWEVLVEQQ